MAKKLKEFLQQQDIQGALASYNFKYIYRKLLEERFVGDSRIPDFTELMLSLDYNPLDYMNYIPDFFLCNSKIKEFTIPNHIKSIKQWAFYRCSGLQNITIPSSVTSIGVGAFFNCNRLTSISIPNSVKKIGYSAFYRCSNLTSITIPNSVTRIGVGAFSECDSLASISIPNSVTSIGYSTFSYCTNLTSITISNSVTRIGRGAFYECNSLETIYYEGTQEDWKEIKISKSGNAHLLNAEIIFKGEK